MIYEWMKNKRPHGIFLKKRFNEDMLIVESNDLNIYYLNKTAAFFVNLSDGNHSIEDIKKMMLEKYDVSGQELEYDLVETVRELQWKNLVILEV